MSTRPNILLIQADQLKPQVLPCYGGVADTPHLDGLAGDGVVFRNAYSASPVCSNSRLALSTGRYAQRWGAYYYGVGGLPTAEFTIAEMMREAGYDRGQIQALIDAGAVRSKSEEI